MHYEYVYDNRRFENKKDRKNVRRVKLFVWFVIFLILIYYTLGFLIQIFRNKNTISLVSPLTEPFSASIDSIKEVINPSKLPRIVQDSFKGTNGTYAVVIKNLKTGESYSLNDNRKFQAASLYKLWIMAETYDLIEKAKLDPQKKIKYKIEDLNKKFEISSDSAELTKGELDTTISKALSQMITISHNYSALALTAEIGLSKVGSFLTDNNFVNSGVGDTPQTTATEIAEFYEKLYRGELGDSDSTQKMIDLLKGQQLNDRIPKYLPDSIEVAHKTGELNFVKHDTGIVFAPNGHYIIVLLSETKDPKSAAEKEALLSKAVYEYFENK